MKDNECKKVKCEFFTVNKKGVSFCTDCQCIIQNIFYCGIAAEEREEVKSA